MDARESPRCQCAESESDEEWSSDPGFCGRGPPPPPPPTPWYMSDKPPPPPRSPLQATDSSEGDSSDESEREVKRLCVAGSAARAAICPRHNDGDEGRAQRVDCRR